MTVNAQIGIIGGSGLYKMSALTDIQEINIDTPFGKTSDAFIYGKLSGTSVVFLARHGRSHHLLPTEVPYRANIYALKSLGVEYIISASAVGSLQEYAKPLDIVLPDQFIDRTTSRTSTFFGEGIVAHVAFGEPICKSLLSVVSSAAESIDLGRNKVHKGGIYLCMEGPAFSTKAESFLYRSWGAKVIGMTNLTEAKLAREAEIAYATLALVTDYDCWHEDHESVTVEMVVQNLQKNAINAQQVIQNAVAKIAANPPKSEAHHALKTAILTDLSKVSGSSLDRLKVILQKYL
ncbi:MAG: S-methyl-5'-thioadenosine phosphorylase [Pseudanabaena sp.]|jgi:5'-methylthioadenosine phosphorylase|uniref:S-methyl-5'-thioadenosine phosphorylase n=1 Tax=Pseudanabaena mucicola TaxID=71190 RepID=UPI0025761E41|nr:S-methyl-5'-thioadenosine phosphorylase [Pseudanabaena mucicola]MCA6575151.1 S-methyl-5'-thioadenosine phosphorylase [Pseudanabaena sp. M53BS1SP1A06MG]MCA6581551.1 S-methyl-5'-thioadenosine phosphorylase [Pseudanabaena sp. M34BS1SP1A06MG]MCA6585748.1 S-methyl-5'-thioadenosine phosphorylase [Pseudanabaena sp. M051S1SP1A06QC]MCA6590344.1 S-methyl-5'-thioadenosine phosphorylase [Pseudanabaena sp. M109S1SP1A06QC]MCA6594524.1 S-methyl-5'-thioadenosine phosphorylase [Pseudanabaena sp. M38BS1SP1A0